MPFAGVASPSPSSIRVIANEPLPLRYGPIVPQPKSVADITFGGNGKISGTVKVKGSPDYPVSRRVILLIEKSNIVIREQWSDSTTGVYEFKNINANLTYSAISFDHTNVNRAVIANGLTPEITQ